MGLNELYGLGGRGEGKPELAGGILPKAEGDASSFIALEAAQNFRFVMGLRI